MPLRNLKQLMFQVTLKAYTKVLGLFTLITDYLNCLQHTCKYSCMALERIAEGKEARFREIFNYRQDGIMWRLFSLHILLYHLIAEDSSFCSILKNSLFHKKSCFFLFPSILKNVIGNFSRSYRKVYGGILGFSR